MGFLVRVDRLLQGRTARAIAFIAAIIAVVSFPIAVYQVILWVRGAS
jgi:hypothetical protein